MIYFSSKSVIFNLINSLHKLLVYMIQLMIMPNSARQYLPSKATNLRRELTRNPTISQHEKYTLVTHQTTAEDDLLSITDEVFIPILNNQIDQQQISAWNHYNKNGPFRVHSPVKQAGLPPNLQSKISLPAKLSEKYGLKSDLKAKLRHYQVNRSIPLSSEITAEIDIQMPVEDYWKNIETLDLEKLNESSANNQKSQRNKMMILQPFYSVSGRKSKNFEKRAKSTNSHQSQDSSHTRSFSSRKEASKFGTTIAHTTELKFPIISEQSKLQTRLSFYRKQYSVSK